MIITEEFAKTVIKERPNDSHKGDFGRVLCIGGLRPYGGAIIMAAMATVYSGAGLVTVGTDKDNITALDTRLPEAMAFDLFDTELLEDQIKTSDVILIGPGLTETSASEAICQFTFSLVNENQIIVCDASALSIMAKHPSDLNDCKAPVILTPHKKEWERVSKIAVDHQTDETNLAVLEKMPSVSVLVYKQHHTKVYQKGQSIRQILIGGPYQATGGSGDTLAGIIAAFVAQFKESSLFDATSAAVYLHSAIADDLSEKAFVTLPTQVSENIPQKMKDLLN